MQRQVPADNVESSLLVVAVFVVGIEFGKDRRTFAPTHWETWLEVMGIRNHSVTALGVFDVSTARRTVQRPAFFRAL